MHDRRIHAALEDGRVIVRYDRAGKWFWETEDHRKHIDFGEAVRLATLSGAHVFLGRPGGSRFDEAVGRVLINRLASREERQDG